MKPKRFGLLVRLLAWIEGGRPVWIFSPKDFNTSTQTIAFIDPFGHLVCYDNVFLRVQRIMLEPDGKIESNIGGYTRWTFGTEEANP